MAESTPEEATAQSKTLDLLIEKLNTETDVAFEFQQRKHDHWRENMELHRDFVQTNRLTQRQAVNFPLMKDTIETSLAATDDPTTIFFDCLEEGDAGKEKEIALNELWQYDNERLDAEGMDILDKKNVFLEGRSHIKLNFLEGKFYMEVLDNYDVLIDPKVNPLDIDSAKWLVHQHIFRPLREILANPKYTTEGKAELKQYLNDKGSLVMSERTKETLEAKQERLANLGIDNFEDFGATDVIVELKEHYTYLWDSKAKKFVRYVIVYADDGVILFKKPLKDVIGVDFLPFVTWAEDVDISDYWSDSRGDMARVPNKILNIWLSQLLENRTLRNYGMIWFNSVNNFTPQTYTPKPFGMYPVPGKPDDFIKYIQIPELTGTIQEMEFIRSIVERATATTSTEKGVSEKKQITLGEIKLLLSQSKEKLLRVAKAYRKSRKQLAEKWFKILDANVSPADSVVLYKKSFKGNIFKKEVKGSDWKSEAGYKVRVLSSSEQEAQKETALSKWAAFKQLFPENPVAQKIAERRIAEELDLSPDEIKEVMEYEEQTIGKIPKPVVPPVEEKKQPLAILPGMENQRVKTAI